MDWVSDKFTAWKNQNKGMKVVIAVCGFLAIAILLSLITGLFT